jgi:autotransporter-associated beta strand protein
MRRLLPIGARCALALLAAGGAGADAVQSPRAVPVVRDVDVVVVGGSCAAVAAAISAKTNGASVLLVAPRTYLGDDVAGTRELWPAPVEEFLSEPLARELFAVKVPFAYTASVTPNATHPDPSNTRLTDGVKYDAAGNSVQYDSNVQITAAFAGAGTVTQADVYYYCRSTSSPFDTVVSAVYASLDGATWSPAAVSVAVEPLAVGGGITTLVSRVTLSGGVRAKYLRVHCDRGPGAVRQLLDELVVHTSLNDPVPGSSYATTPLSVKRGLELALEDASVPFLGGSPVCDVLKDGAGRPAGVVLANRSGRQAVRARAVVDATEGAWPALRAGASKTAFVPGSYSFSRIVVADATNAPSAPGLSVYALPGLSYATTVSGVSAPFGMPGVISGRVFRCTFATNLVSGSAAELLEVEQAARDLTWVRTCIDQSDRLSWLPPDHVVGAASETATSWANADALNLDAFKPSGVPYLYVLSARADVPRALAAEMQSPARLMALGDRIGAAAAAAALAREPLAGVALPEEPGLTLGEEDVSELLSGLPPANTNAAGSVSEGLRALPELGSCDVLVVGGGTAGAPAAIAAGRAGASTVVIEYLYGMGGVQTDGRIGSYYHGNPCGFTTSDVDPGVGATGSVLAMSKSEWYRQACRAAGVRVLFGSLASGVLMAGDALKGVVVVLPDGSRGVVRARSVVDATGNAELAAAAGEETEHVTASEPAIQGAGLARHIMGSSYNNSDVGFVSGADAADTFFFARRAHVSMPASTWDAGQNPASRERRRLVGVLTVTPIDILNGRTYPDTITRPRSNFDSHGFTVHDLFFIRDPGTSDVSARLPLRALLPKRVDGLLVTGLGISAHRDAMPILRMQPDVQNEGYAAGYAAALAVSENVAVRNVSIAALQSHLVDKGIIGAADMGTPDSFPLSTAAIQAAVNGLTNNYATLHTVLADEAAALPMLRAAYAAQTEAAPRLIYAHVLGLLRDPTGTDALVAAVEAGAWDTGWNYKGMGQYGRSVSTMDSLVIALGRTLQSGAVSPVLAKAAQLTGASYFSHIRAVSFALEELESGSGVAALSALLGGVRGYALTNALVAPAIAGYSDTVGDSERNNCLKELAVARALFRLGDDAGGGGAAVLGQYARDPREVYASHARQVLSSGQLSVTSDGVWTGAALAADWAEAANWLGGVRAGGAGASAVITNAVAGPQTISLGGALKSLGYLAVAGAARTVRDGVLDLGAGEPAVTVAAGSRATVAAELLSGSAVVKDGGGELAIAGAATIGGLDVEAGDVSFADPGAQFFRAYSADPAVYNTTVSAGPAVSLRTDFRVNAPIILTHLGAYDSSGDGFENFKKVSVYPRAGGAPLASLAFSAAEVYPLEGGYRFRRLPGPLSLPAGEYAIVTFGYFGNDCYIEANTGAVGARAGSTDDGAGALTFLTNAYSTVAGALAFPAAVLPSASDYAVSAASFRFASGASVKSLSGPLTLPAGSRVDVAALDARLSGGLVPGAGGLGSVTNASAAFPVTLRLGVAAGATNTLAGGAFGDRADGPLTLVKEGGGLLDLVGPLAFGGGLRVGGGQVRVDAPAALGGGELSFGMGGQLLMRSGGTLDRMLYVENQAVANDRSTRVVVPPGGALTLTRGVEIPRMYEYGGFAIQAYDDGAGPTRAVLSGAQLGYLDLYLLGDGPSGGGASAHDWTNVRGALRKLASGNDTRVGSRVTLGAGCDFSANWFDVAGSNAVVSITNGAAVRSTGEVRFVDGNASQLSLDGGTLRAAVVGVANGNNQHLSLRPVLFNGGVVEAVQSSDVFWNLSEASAAPLIRSGGAIFDTAAFSVAIRGRGFAQEPGSAGVFVKRGAGTLKIAAQMTYTGLTIVSNGTLRLDFALWRGTNAGENVLAPTAEVLLAPGAALEVAGVTNAAGAAQHRQSLARVVSMGGVAAGLCVEQADVSASALEGAFDKLGSGTLALACDAGGSATLPRLLTVQEGVFAVRGARTNVTVSVPYAGFESSPLLPLSPTPPTTAMDARGTAATNCPGWVFAATSGNHQSGYQRNLSYFSSGAATAAPEGLQTAFVRQNGSMQASLAFPTNGTYTLRFRHCSRYYSNWYTNEVIYTLVDGVTNDALVVNNRVFMERAVSLGHVSAGLHVLRFQGSNALPSYGGDPCALIDDVRIAGVSDVLGAAAASDEEAVLDVAAGARVDLDYTGALRIGELVLDGVTYRGGWYGASTHPAIFTGSGVIHPKTGGTHLILR